MKVFIDNNIWNYFYKNKIDIAKFFPKENYTLHITTHGRYEIYQMRRNNPELYDYAMKVIDGLVTEDPIFGFLNEKFPKEFQRISGFNKGRYTTEEENRVRGVLSGKYGASQKNRDWMILFPREADIELASRAIENVVLTFESNKGPLLDIEKMGGKVVLLNYEESETTETNEFMEKVIELIEKHRD